MSALFRIVYAAHANGTHHKLALDALTHMQRRDADAWTRVFLKYIDKYLEGAKAPDNTFKDFKNHVLHVGEKYWGGAPEKVEEWYATTVTALATGQWEDAAYAAGVLSHYYTDPIMPFHTAQTEAENAIHRATEWSINRSYNTLRKSGEEKFANLEIEVHDGPHWVKEATCDGAEFSHRYYEKLIAHYDIHKGTVRPEDGLDTVAQNLVAELLMYAATGFSRILDRAIAESGAVAPDVGLTLETFLATLKIPSKWIEKKLTNAEDKKLVQAMYDELKATGRVDKTLTEDDRTIRDLHATEVLAPKLAARSAARAERVPGSATPTGQTALQKAVAKSAMSIERVLQPPALQSAAATAPIFAAPKTSASLLPAPEPDPAPAAVAIVETPLALPPKVTLATPRYEPDVEPVRTAAPVVPAPFAPKPFAEAPVATSPVIPHVPKAPYTEPAERRSYLAETDDLEAAPSIGPKMAARFAELGIKTVAEFLGHDPHDMAELLDDSRIDAEELTDWQDQAHLVIAVPGLRGTHAQLLVGAGYRTADAIADSDPVDLSADVLKFATTSDGKRLLRDGNPPDIEKIKDWVESARIALAA